MNSTVPVFIVLAIALTSLIYFRQYGQQKHALEKAIDQLNFYLKTQADFVPKLTTYIRQYTSPFLLEEAGFAREELLLAVDMEDKIAASARLEQLLECLLKTAEASVGRTKRFRELKEQFERICGRLRRAKQVYYTSLGIYGASGVITK